MRTWKELTLYLLWLAIMYFDAVMTALALAVSWPISLIECYLLGKKVTLWDYTQLANGQSVIAVSSALLTETTFKELLMTDLDGDGSFIENFEKKERYIIENEAA